MNSKTDDFRNYVYTHKQSEAKNIGACRIAQNFLQLSNLIQTPQQIQQINECILKTTKLIKGQESIDEIEGFLPEDIENIFLFYLNFQDANIQASVINMLVKFMKRYDEMPLSDPFIQTIATLFNTIPPNHTAADDIYLIIRSITASDNLDDISRLLTAIPLHLIESRPDIAVEYFIGIIYNITRIPLDPEIQIHLFEYISEKIHHKGDSDNFSYAVWSLYQMMKFDNFCFQQFIESGLFIFLTDCLFYDDDVPSIKGSIRAISQIILKTKSIQQLAPQHIRRISDLSLHSKLQAVQISALDCLTIIIQVDPNAWGAMASERFSSMLADSGYQLKMALTRFFSSFFFAVPLSISEQLVNAGFFNVISESLQSSDRKTLLTSIGFLQNLTSFASKQGSIGFIQNHVASEIDIDTLTDLICDPSIDLDVQRQATIAKSALLDLPLLKERFERSIGI